jgi:hypothetical protein
MPLPKCPKYKDRLSAIKNNATIKTGVFRGLRNVPPIIPNGKLALLPLSLCQRPLSIRCSREKAFCELSASLWKLVIGLTGLLVQSLIRQPYHLTA